MRRLRRFYRWWLDCRHGFRPQPKLANVTVHLDSMMPVGEIAVTIRRELARTTRVA